MYWQRILVWIVVVGWLSGCSAGSAPPYVRPEGCGQRVLHRFYFGMESDEGTISEKQWQRFLQEVVTPRFPSGLTVMSAQGQWIGRDDGIVREPSKVVEIVHDNSAKDQDHIEDIVEKYKRRFDQEAVLVLKSDVVACY